jgi:hypothetical protein
MIKKKKFFSEPTKSEYKRLDRHISMRDTHFDVLKIECYLIHTLLISNDDLPRYNYAYLYGFLRTRISEPNEPVMDNFFVRYKDRLYQTFFLVEAIEIMKLIEKEIEYDKYNTTNGAAIKS